MTFIHGSWNKKFIFSFLIIYLIICIYLKDHLLKIEDYLYLLENIDWNIFFKVFLTALYFLRFSNLSIFLTIDFQTENMAERMSTRHL